MGLANRQVYVVGDDAQHNTAVSSLLNQRCDTLTVECWDTDAIIRLTPTTPVDVVVLDPLLPKYANSLEIFLNMANLLHAIPAFAQVPVVAMSAAEPAILIPFLREVGFRGFLRKPLNGTHFCNQLSDILDGKQVWEYR